MTSRDRNAEAAWLRRLLAVSLDRRQWARLAARLKLPEELGEASPESLREIGGMTLPTAARLREGAPQEAVEAELAAMDAAGARLLTFDHPEYPAILRHMAAPPMALYVAGEILPRDDLAVAVVGPRSPSTHGREAARRISEGLARAGLTVVSGFAAGVDGLAHMAALAAGGRTLAALGCGLAVNYPAEHESLRRKILESRAGALLSELPMTAQAMRHHFPARNALIAGLALAVVVIEAAENSGALLTAHAALEEGRTVFAVPGDITRTTSRGSNALLREGAIALTCAEELLEDLRPQIEPLYAAHGVAAPWSDSLPAARKDTAAPPSSANGGAPHESHEARRLIERIAREPADLDTLIAEFTPDPLDPGRLSTLLLQLEIAGKLRKAPGNLYFSR